MALRRNFHPHPEVARLQRKADQEDEMGCLASQDGDRPAAKAHFDKAKEYRQQAREIADCLGD
jgi:hypothetical protein